VRYSLVPLCWIVFGLVSMKLEPTLVNILSSFYKFMARIRVLSENSTFHILGPTFTILIFQI
jgi:hypothetical protein